MLEALVLGMPLHPLRIHKNGNHAGVAYKSPPGFLIVTSLSLALGHQTSRIDPSSPSASTIFRRFGGHSPLWALAVR